MRAFLAAVAVFLLLIPAGQVRAEAICACYYGDYNHCEYYFDEDGTSFPSSATACSIFCMEEGRHPDTVNVDWDSDSGSQNAIDLGGDCTDAEADADTAEAVATASSTPASAVRPTILPQLQVAIPDVSFASAVVDGGYVDSNFLGTYVAGVYKFLLGFAVLIATVFVMAGGVQYVVGASTGEIGKAKERIRNAVVGLVLLMSIYAILFVVNPQTTLFNGLKVKYVAEIPTENFFEPTAANAMACTASGADLRGVNTFQDCMLANYGASESEARSRLVSVSYRGRTYQVHELMKADFEAALAAIDASGVDYDITWDTAGGTFNWRCNKNSPKAVSAHGWGSAIDVNPSVNPNCPPSCRDHNEDTSCSCVGGNESRSCADMCDAGYYDIPPEVVSAFKNNGFSWGGDYSRTKDYMHFTHARICKGG